MAEPKNIYTLDELEAKLTPKQKNFCYEYIIDWNATRAAKKAGYSEQTAYSIGNENLRKPEIIQYIDFIKNDIAKQAGISKLKIVLEQNKIAFSSIAHLHETWIKRVEFEKLEDYQKDCIQEIETKIKTEYEYNPETGKKEPINVEFVKIKLYDKQKALDSITKMMGWNEPERFDHSSKDGSMTPVNLSTLSTEELEKRYELAKKIEDKQEK